MIDHDSVIKEFIDLTRIAVGAQLSTVLVSDVPTPAVIKKRTGGPTPNYPYIIIGVEDRSNITPHLINKTVNNDDAIVHHRLEDFLISFQCYGENSFSILSQLHQYFDIESVRDSIRSSTGGAIRKIDNVTIDPQPVKDMFIESHHFNLVWGSENTITGPVDCTIETVTITYN